MRVVFGLVFLLVFSAAAEEEIPKAQLPIITVKSEGARVAAEFTWDRNKNSVKVAVRNPDGTTSEATGELKAPSYLHTSRRDESDVNAHHFKMKKPLKLQVDGKEVLIQWMTDMEFTTHNGRSGYDYLYESVLWSVNPDGTSRGILGFQRKTYNE